MSNFFFIIIKYFSNLILLWACSRTGIQWTIKRSLYQPQLLTLANHTVFTCVLAPVTVQRWTKPHYRTSAVVLDFHTFLKRKWTPIRPPTPQSAGPLPTIKSRRKPSSFDSNKHRWTRPHYRISAVVLDFQVFRERKWTPIRPPTLQSSEPLPTVESRRKPSSFDSNKHRWTKPHYRTSAVVLDFQVLERKWTRIRPPTL